MRAARRRGWEIFALGLVFRVQAQLLGMGPLTNLFKVDMLNTMGLSIVLATFLWQLSPHRRSRVAGFALVTVVATWQHHRTGTLRTVLAVLVGVGAVATLVWIALTGDAGARAVWGS